MEFEAPWASLAIGGLAVWRLTHLLHAEAGPGDVFLRLRRWLGSTALAGVMGCFLCLSLWVAAPVAAVIAPGWRAGVLLWLALSTIAIAVERLITAGGVPAPAWDEHTEDDADVLLRGRNEERAVDIRERTGATPADRPAAGTAADDPDGIRRLEGAHGRRSDDR